MQKSGTLSITDNVYCITIGASMIWPFLMIYVSEKLGLPLRVLLGNPG